MDILDIPTFTAQYNAIRRDNGRQDDHLDHDTRLSALVNDCYRSTRVAICELASPKEFESAMKKVASMKVYLCHTRAPKSLQECATSIEILEDTLLLSEACTAIQKQARVSLRQRWAVEAYIRKSEERISIAPQINEMRDDMVEITKLHFKKYSPLGLQ